MARPEQYGELRLLDLVCKLSRSRPATVKAVLDAVGIVAKHFGMAPSQVVVSLDDAVGPPAPGNVAACAAAAQDVVDRQRFRLPPAKPRQGQRAARRMANCN